MHFLPDIFLLKWLLWFPVLGFWSNSGGNTSSSSVTTVTPTTSGGTSPITQGGGGSNESTQSTGAGSIGVSGTGAKYLEQGSTDLAGSGTITGSTLEASGGSTIQIGSPQAVDALSQIAEQLATANTSQASTSAGSSGGGGGGVAGTITTLTQNINWTMIAIVGAIVLGLYLMFGKKK